MQACLPDEGMSPSDWMRGTPISAKVRGRAAGVPSRREPGRTPTERSGPWLLVDPRLRPLKGRSHRGEWSSQKQRMHWTIMDAGHPRTDRASCGGSGGPPCLRLVICRTPRGPHGPHGRVFSGYQRTSAARARRSNRPTGMSSHALFEAENVDRDRPLH